MFYRMFYSLTKETEDLPTINIGKASSSSVTGGCAHNSQKGPIKPLVENGHSSWTIVMT